jgi:hypothetical protein
MDSVQERKISLRFMFMDANSTCMKTHKHTRIHRSWIARKNARNVFDYRKNPPPHPNQVLNKVSTQTTVYISSDSDEEVQSVRRGHMQVSNAHDPERDTSPHQRGETGTHEHPRHIGNGGGTMASRNGSVRQSVGDHEPAKVDTECGEEDGQGGATCSGSDVGVGGAASDTGNVKSARRQGEIHR